MTEERLPQAPPDPGRGDPDRVALDELLRAFGVDAADQPDQPAATGEGHDLTDEQLDALLADDEDRAARAEPAAVGPAVAGEPLPLSVAPPQDDTRAADDDSGGASAAQPSTVRTDEDRAADDASADASTARPSKVIKIGGEDLPDTVFVSGDLGGDSSPSGGSVVLIEDDNTGDALVPDARGRFARGIEPRLRDRRISVRRAEGLRRLRWLFVAAAVVLLLVGALAVLGSSLFAVDAGHVRVTGAVYTDADRLDRVIDELVGTPVLTVDTESVEDELEAIPWVDTARVTTRFPRGVSIEIRERRPLAAFQGPDGRFRVIDRYGRVLDVIDGQPVAYMLVTSPDSTDLAEGEFAPAGFRAAAELVQSLTASVRSSVTSIDVAGDGSQLRLLLGDGVEVRFGSASDLLAKLVRLETILQAARDRGATIVDVSTNPGTIR